jgi:hypothetical protein
VQTWYPWHPLLMVSAFVCSVVKHLYFFPALLWLAVELLQVQPLLGHELCNALACIQPPLPASTQIQMVRAQCPLCELRLLTILQHHLY